jgi:hypothetical protein
MQTAAARLSFVSFVTFVSFVPLASAASQGKSELIERTMAIVGNQVITLSDVRTALALGLTPASTDRDPISTATRRLVDRLLVLREVQRYAPPEPPEAQIDQELTRVRERFASPGSLTEALEEGGFSEAGVRAWVRDDLRIASYLSQRFAAVVVPADDEVASYYASHRQEFAEATFEAAAPLIRERLTAERRAELIDDWIADLHRRTVVVELWPKH